MRVGNARLNIWSGSNDEVNGCTPVCIPSVGSEDMLLKTEKLHNSTKNKQTVNTVELLSYRDSCFVYILPEEL